jgi:hypothetical protein
LEILRRLPFESLFDALFGPIAARAATGVGEPINDHAQVICKEEK